MSKRVYIVPHTHYDAEVFISREETFQRGFSNLQIVMSLFKTDPDFTFSLDQVCYVEPYLRRYPEERDFFVSMVREGRLEIVGGMYVMPDLNIPSGESFVRQVLYGRRYFEEELGVDVKAGWTLDSFGHHPQIPQLMTGSGFDYTMFQRLMHKGGPSDFRYRGIDGTELLCHWMPASYAVFHGCPGNLHEFTDFAERRLRLLQEHSRADVLLAATGADIEPPDPALLRLAKEYNASQDRYELVFGSSKDFMDVLKKERDLPVVTEDLNPVFQGCYSARIEVKQAGRELEVLLQNWEKADAVAKSLGIEVREERRDDAWEKVMFNQFHDIICGSHVDKVFAATMSRYQEARGEAGLGTERRLQEIAALVQTEGEGIPVVVFNMLGWERTDVVECSVAFSDPDVLEVEVRASDGKAVPHDLVRTERFASGALKRTGVLFVGRKIPAFGYEVYRIVPSPSRSPEGGLVTSEPLNLREDKDRGWIENQFVRASFDLWNGSMTGLRHKETGWEALAEAPRVAGTVVREQDYGNFWQYNAPCKGDAFHPMEDRYPLPALNANQADFSSSYYGDGSIWTGRAHVQFSIGHPFGSGYYATRVRLYAGIPRIDVQTTLVNNEERVRYRAVFPTSIRGGSIVHEIPFGSIQRPEGEYPAQNWIDYSDGEKGISLLNRGLPGNNVVDGVMMLSLMKCTALKEGYGEGGGFRLGVPTERGYELGIHHTFDYALLPHAGDWRQARSYRAGLELNTPLLPVKPGRHAGKLPARKSFLAVSAENVVLSCVKPCRDGTIVRVYEAEGRATRGVELLPSWTYREASLTDLVERVQGKAERGQAPGSVRFDLGPFQIRTIKLAQ